MTSAGLPARPPKKPEMEASPIRVGREFVATGVEI
jgi:hypothetical protein